MKENPTGGINYSAIKKYLIVAITFLSMLIISLITIVICNSNSILNSSNNNKNSVFAEETFDEAKKKYALTIMYNIIYNYRLPLTATSHSTYYNSTTQTVYWVKYATFDRNQSAESYEQKTGINASYLSYNISNVTEYANFCKLTHHKEPVQTGSITYPNVGIGKYVSYPTYKSHKTYQFYHDKVGLTLDTIGNNKIVFSSDSYTLADDEDPPDNASWTDPPAINETTFSLDNFRMNVSLNESITHTLAGGKAVDEKENILYFKGSFNGNGNTINFIGKDKYYPSELDFYAEGSEKCYSPFCCFLDKGGEIKNVKLNYINLDPLLIDDGITGASYVGGIVGRNDGEVIGCIVDCPQVKSERYDDYAHYGALSAINNGAILYCMVDGTYSIHAHKWKLGEPSGINAYWGTVMGPNMPYGCLWKANVVETKETSQDRDFILSPADVGKVADPDDRNKQLVYSYAGHEDSSTCYDTFNYLGYLSNMKNEKYYKLGSISEVGGTVEQTGTWWYFAEDYYNYPLLRAFVGWKEFNITLNDPNLGSVSPDSLIIPSNVNSSNPCGLNDQLTNKTTIYILGRQVTAYPAENAQVYKWEFTKERYWLTVYFRVDCKTFQLGDKGSSTKKQNYELRIDGEVKTIRDNSEYIQWFVVNHDSIDLNLINEKLDPNGSDWVCTEIRITFYAYKKEKKGQSYEYVRNSSQTSIVVKALNGYLFNTTHISSAEVDWDDSTKNSWFDIPDLKLKTYNVIISS